MNSVRDKDLNSLGVSRDEVKAALAREHRPAVRKRLVAISKIAAGKSINQAAQAAAKALRESVERWIGQIQRSGFQSLLADGRHGRPKRWMNPSKTAQARRQIASALSGPFKPEVRARLIAVDTVLSGERIEEAAATARVVPNTVRSWLRMVTYDGIAATLARWESQGKPRPRLLVADPVVLRELAAKEMNWRIRKRILALARVAEGMSLPDAAVSVGLQYDTVLRSMKRFRKEGVAAFQDPKSAGRPPKLTSAQLEEVGRTVLQFLEMSYTEMSELLWARFRVSYSFESLRRLRRSLKAKLGVAWKPARSNAAARNPRGGPRNLSKPELGEVGKVVLTRPELSYSDLCDLIWTRFRVRYSRDRLRHLLNVELGIEWKPVRSNAAAGNPRAAPRELSKPQLEELRDYVLKRTETSFSRLHHLVWNRFRVRHSHASLKRLLKTEFGIEWTAADKRLGQGLNLAELQGALANTTDWRVKKKLRALIDLVNGHDANTVARANRVKLETLRNWVRRYRTRRLA
jgi:transposase